MRLTRQEHEERARQMATYHISCANFVSKITVCHFAKRGIPHQTIYDVLKRYDERKTANFLPKSDQSSKLSSKDVQVLVKSVNNKTSISQRRFGVHQWTLSRTVKNKTTDKIYTRKAAPKYRHDGQKECVQLNCWKLYKILKSYFQLILEDKNYFSLMGDMSSNHKYYTIDLFTSPPKVTYKTKTQFELKLLVWMAVSQKGMSSI